jgi:ABC-type Fe3+-siderophore transport system permease subunit
MLKMLNEQPRRIFLLDGIGALLTALLLTFLLARFQEAFGMPVSVLRILATIAFAFAIYSFICYFAAEKWRPFLKFIAIANVTYCLVTSILLITNYKQLTVLGLVYFLAEILIILTLAIYEWRLSDTLMHSHFRGSQR